jgi:hypothetical protein
LIFFGMFHIANLQYIKHKIYHMANLGAMMSCNERRWACGAVATWVDGKSLKITSRTIWANWANKKIRAVFLTHAIYFALSAFREVKYPDMKTKKAYRNKRSSCSPIYHSHCIANDWEQPGKSGRISIRQV